MDQRTYLVDGMTCDHCVRAVSSEVGGVPGVEAVAVDLESKRLVVTGAFDDDDLFAAVVEAGYEATALPAEP